MDSKQIRTFTEKYLTLHNCQLIESAPTHLITQLSIPVDKDLLNRPFYWMYVEKMNLQPQPARLCFFFEPDHPTDLRGEHLFFGSPRFNQLLDSAQKHGRFVRVYQEPSGWQRPHSSSRSYTPWLGVNFKISYVCDQQKDRICYLGMDMRSGQIKEQFYSSINELNWSTKLPPNRYTVSPPLTVAEAVGELEYFLQEQLGEENHAWANDAMKRLDAEIEQLQSFYPDDTMISDELLAEKKKRQREIIWQYHPRIEIKIVNTGLFYMEDSK